ncbi:unnamed protein product [Colias eurytheme]|nr:unnamed protein product [Colias eurytheme]
MFLGARASRVREGAVSGRRAAGSYVLQDDGGAKSAACHASGRRDTAFTWWHTDRGESNFHAGNAIVTGRAVSTRDRSQLSLRVIHFRPPHRPAARHH